MNRTIPFHQPTFVGTEITSLEALLAGTDRHFGAEAEMELRALTGATEVLLTTSCTHALEMCALLLDIQVGDEIIMPSFTFVSAANAFVLRGARIVFVDIEPGSMNVDPVCIEAAVNERTRAVLIMHYGGVACDLEALQAITTRAGIPLIEDAAHCIGAYYKNQHLGTFGDLGTLSFHHTKNIQCSEGGALLINNEGYRERAMILRDKGTNRRAFLEGKIDRYSWVDVGSSYTLGEVNAGILLPQFRAVQQITNKRQRIWSLYYEQLYQFLPKSYLPVVPAAARHNAHLFALHCRDRSERLALQQYLNGQGIQAYFHYVPLHTSVAGQRFGSFQGKDRYTTERSGALLRLPLYTSMLEEDAQRVVATIREFYAER